MSTKKKVKAPTVHIEHWEIVEAAIEKCAANLNAITDRKLTAEEQLFARTYTAWKCFDIGSNVFRAANDENMVDDCDDLSLEVSVELFEMIKPSLQQMYKELLENK